MPFNYLKIHSSLKFCLLQQNMAYAALLSLELSIHQILPTIKDGLLFPIKKKNFLNLSFSSGNTHLCRREQLESLQKNVLVLQKLLQESPEKCVTLESRIRKVAYQLEDIIESSMSGQPFMYFASKLKNLHRGQMYFAFVKYTHEADSIIQKAGKIIDKKSEHCHKPGVDFRMGSSASGARSGEDTLGLNNDLRELLDRTTCHAPGLQFISIIGMGGIGKTTLARNIYDDKLTAERFDVRFWITVSQEYDLKKILLGLLQCEEELEDHCGLLIVRIHKILKGRRFLIVLDDMWHVDFWNRIMSAFPNDGDGSRIIITSRHLEVVQKVNSSSYIHQMKFLSEEQSWFLIRREVFGLECCPLELETMGKVIASNCKGLPLAIAAIVGPLKVNRARVYWEGIAQNVVKAGTTATNDQLLGILSLSYENLPHHMKACFLYMGVFPEDFQVPSDTLIQLLVGEGLVKPKDPKSMEEVAEECMKDLVSRNLVLHQMDRRNKTWYSIHDVLRELSRRKAEEECFHQHCKNIDKHCFSKIIKGQRRVILHPSICSFLPYNKHKSPVRSVLCFDTITTTSLLHYTSQFKLLKMVYNLTITSQEDLSSPHSVLFKLIHLKFLGLNFDKNVLNSVHDVCISESIYKLQHLQTLRVEYIPSSSRDKIILPWNVWRMEKMRHVILPLSHLFSAFLPDIRLVNFDLHNLQTLSGVTNFKFTRDAVISFPNLKILRIGYRRVEKWEEYHLDNLVHLHQLQELEFWIMKDLYPKIKIDIAFPQSLKRLTLENIKIPLEIGRLHHLEVLVLRLCWFEGIWESSEGEFHQLKHLLLQIVSLDEWIAEDTHFPSLEELFVQDCSFEIPECIGDIPTIEKLTIESCSEKTEESVKRIKNEQLSNGNNKLQILIKKIVGTWS